MGKINKVNKQTTNPYLNLYDLDVVNKVGREDHYYVASRAKTEDDLKLSHAENNDPDGVAIYSLYGEKKDRVVLIYDAHEAELLKDHKEPCMNCRPDWWIRERIITPQRSGN